MNPTIGAKIKDHAHRPQHTVGRHTYKLPKNSLSSRETEVCKLLIEGLPVKEVALRLNVSPNTANSHTRNAYRKLGVQNRAELVNYFAEPNVKAVRDTLTDSMSSTPQQKLN